MDELLKSPNEQSVLKVKKWIQQQHLSFMRTALPSILLIHPVLSHMIEKSMRFA